MENRYYKNSLYSKSDRKYIIKQIICHKDFHILFLYKTKIYIFPVLMKNLPAHVLMYFFTFVSFS